MSALDAHAFLAVYGRVGDAGLLYWIMVALSAVGSGWILVLALPLAARREVRRELVAFAVVVAASAVVVALVKAGVGRARPFVALAGVTPRFFDRVQDPSFPSGHAAGSFTVLAYGATRFAEAVRTSKAARAGLAVATLVAAGVAASRVALGFHYPFDVLAGSLVGIGFGAWGARATEPLRSSPRDRSRH